MDRNAKIKWLARSVVAVFWFAVVLDVVPGFASLIDGEIWLTNSVADPILVAFASGMLCAVLLSSGFWRDVRRLFSAAPSRDAASASVVPPTVPPATLSVSRENMRQAVAVPPAPEPWEISGPVVATETVDLRPDDFSPKDFSADEAVAVTPLAADAEPAPAPPAPPALDPWETTVPLTATETEALRPAEESFAAEPEPAVEMTDMAAPAPAAIEILPADEDVVPETRVAEILAAPDVPPVDAPVEVVPDKAPAAIPADAFVDASAPPAPDDEALTSAAPESALEPWETSAPLAETEAEIAPEIGSETETPEVTVSAVPPETEPAPVSVDPWEVPAQPVTTETEADVPLPDDLPETVPEAAGVTVSAALPEPEPEHVLPDTGMEDEPALAVAFASVERVSDEIVPAAETYPSTDADEVATPDAEIPDADIPIVENPAAEAPMDEIPADEPQADEIPADIAAAEETVTAIETDAPAIDLLAEDFLAAEPLAAEPGTAFAVAGDGAVNADVHLEPDLVVGDEPAERPVLLTDDGDIVSPVPDAKPQEANFAIWDGIAALKTWQVAWLWNDWEPVSEELADAPCLPTFLRLERHLDAGRIVNAAPVDGDWTYADLPRQSLIDYAIAAGERPKFLFAEQRSWLNCRLREMQKRDVNLPELRDFSPYGEVKLALYKILRIINSDVVAAEVKASMRRGVCEGVARRQEAGLTYGYERIPRHLWRRLTIDWIGNVSGGGHTYTGLMVKFRDGYLDPPEERGAAPKEIAAYSAIDTYVHDADVRDAGRQSAQR